MTKSGGFLVLKRTIKDFQELQTKFLIQSPKNLIEIVLFLNLFSIFRKLKLEALCDVIKIRLKRRIATRSWKENQPLNIKTAIERPILKLGNPNFRWGFYFILLLVTSLLFRRIFMTSHMTLSSASFNYINIDSKQL